MLKRGFDIIVASSALVILSPMLLIISLLIIKNLGSPVIFAQSRPGKNGQIFKIMKFRTMLNSKDVRGKLLPDEDRLTKFGIWL